MGDFNCKLGKPVPVIENPNNNNSAGTTPEKTDNSSKGGKILKQLLEQQQLKTVNSMSLCKGEWTWTRTVLGEIKKSTIDYIIVEEDHASSISEANIDEEKLITPYHGSTQKTYTDHRAFTITINTSILVTADKRKRKIMTSKE